MKSYLILTAAGPDRPGIVDEVSAALAQRGLNIESSRMAVLGGEFALILLASGEAAEIQKLAASPQTIGEPAGLTVSAKKAAPPESRALPASLPYRLAASGMDHPGIVHEISRVLHSFQVNIEALDTQVAPAPVSGAPIFTMQAVLAVPAAVKIKQLKAALDELGDSLNMDIEFEAEE
jgi:glycine cleavage system transcriptional repressor